MEAWREELYHYGAKGMHWGTLHWQNYDGTFNAAGKERYFGRGTGENYHKLKKTVAAVNDKAKQINSQAKKLDNQVKTVQNQVNKVKNFKLTDEQKKKIATAAVATLATAAVVGGTVYLVKSGAAKDLIAKGKQATSEASEIIRSHKIDPHGFINADIVKNTVRDSDAKVLAGWKDWDNGKATTALGKIVTAPEEIRKTQMVNQTKRSWDSAYKRLVNDLSDKEIASINNGEKTLHDFYKDRLAKGFYSSTSSNNGVSNLVGQVGSKVKTAVSTGKNAAVRVGAGVKTAAKTTSNAAKTAYKVVRSDNAKQAYKNASKKALSALKSTGDATKTAASIAKLIAEHPQETKAAVDRIRNATNSSRAKSAVKQYRREHPGTKMTDAEIARNLGY